MSDFTPSDGGWYLDEYDGDRFWSRVNFRGGTEHLSDPYATAEGNCWIWHKGTGDHYAGFKAFGKEFRAHRLAYLDFGNKIPDGMVVDHLCRNKRCVRPSHLEAVTQAVNVQRGIIGAKTHCNHGHEFTPENSGANLNGPNAGVRYCRTCKSEQRKALYRKSKAQ